MMRFKMKAEFDSGTYPMSDVEEFGVECCGKSVLEMIGVARVWLAEMENLAAKAEGKNLG